MDNRKLEFEIDRKNLEFEINRIRQESLFVYDLLISRYEILFDILPSKRIQSNTNSKRIQKNTKFSKLISIFFKTLICNTLRQIIGETCLEKAVSVILFIGLLVANLLNRRIPTVILLIMWLLLWLFRLCRDFLKLETSREKKLELVHRFLEENKHKAEKDLVVINELCSVAHISTLDFVLAEIKDLIDERQAQAEVYISFVPILSLVSVILVFRMLGISDLQAFVNTLFSGSVAGVPGFIVLVTLMNNFITKWRIQRGEIFALKRSAVLLEQAKNILENIKNKAN